MSISDTGMGIAPDILGKVFDPFFSTKQNDKGTGLGLSQVHGFAHQSGGTVTIRSALGQGTTITIYLPAAHSEVDRETVDEVGEAARGQTALLVEDNPDVAEVSQMLLEQLGYKVEIASDAKVALDIITAGRTRFDIVVSDIVMAGPMDGLGLARALRERKPELPVLLVTGYSDRAAALDAEFPVLRKPYQMPDLHRAMASAISRSAPSAASNLVNLRGRTKPPR
ncbi:MAG: response regulator [Alphaproteobacteria bacterium]|nr:response regulator [Alphaproteobacteria bacterium]